MAIVEKIRMRSISEDDFRVYRENGFIEVCLNFEEEDWELMTPENAEEVQKALYELGLEEIIRETEFTEKSIKDFELQRDQDGHLIYATYWLHHSVTQERDESGKFTAERPKKEVMRVYPEERQLILKRRELEQLEFMETFQDRERLSPEQEKIYASVQEALEAFVLHFNPDYEFEESDYDIVYESVFIVVKKALAEED